MRFAQAGALHEFDVDAVEDAVGAAHISETLDALVGDQRERTVLAEPGGVVRLILGHGLLDENDATRSKPLDHAKRFGTIAPALVGVDGDGSIRDFADGFDEFAVGRSVAAEFHFDDFVGRGLVGFGADDFRGVDADGERRNGRARGVEAPNAVPRRAEFFADPIMERDIDGGFGGGVAGSQGVDRGKNFLELKGIGDARKVDPIKKRRRGGLAFAEIGRHRGLAVADDALVFDLDHHGRRGGARGGGDGECVSQFERVGIVAQVHPEIRRCSTKTGWGPVTQAWPRGRP